MSRPASEIIRPRPERPEARPEARPFRPARPEARP